MKTKTKSAGESALESVGLLTPDPSDLTTTSARPRLPDPVQMRVFWTECSLAPGFNRSDLALSPEFVEDIRTRGVVVPLIVRQRADANYEVFAGARRWSAAKQAGVTEVPVAVYPENTPTQAMLELRLIENLQREGLTALDEARQLREAQESGDYGTGREAVAALARRIGKSATHVYNRLRLLKASKAVQEAIESGKLEVSCAELLAGIPDPKDESQALKEILTEGQQARIDDKWVRLPMSFREARSHIREEYSRPLKSAKFDPKDETLTKAGACAACIWRSGNIEGFDGSPDVCTKTKCFEGKTEAHFARIEDAARKEGRKVMSKAEYEKTRYCGDYVNLDSTCHEDDKSRKWRQILGKGCPPTTVARDRDDGLVELLPKQTALKAAKERGIKFERADSDCERRNRKEQAERKERTARLSKVADAAARTIEAKAACEPDKEFWPLFAELAFCACSYEGREAFCKSQWPDIAKEINHDDAITQEIKRVKSEPRAESKLRALAIKLLCSDRTFNRYSGDWEEGFLAMCEWAGVDLARLEKAVSESASKPVSGKNGRAIAPIRPIKPKPGARNGKPKPKTKAK